MDLRLYFSNKGKNRLSITGHLKITCGGVTVFDRHNLIVDEGKGWVMDMLCELLSPSGTYTPTALNAIVLTSETSPEVLGDTFKTKVFDNGTALNKISSDGILHTDRLSLTPRSDGTLNFQVLGRLDAADGNNIDNNQINSVCLCSGVNIEGMSHHDQISYTESGNERILARVQVGNLVKALSKSYEFSWTVTIE